MADYTYPTERAFCPTAQEWAIRSNVVLSVAQHTGSVKTLEAPGARWLVRMDYRAHKVADRARVEAFWANVRGMVNRVLLFHAFRPQPRGTMRGSPALAVQAEYGAVQLSITTTAYATLLAGDMVKVGSQLVMVVGDVAANGSGAMTATITPPLRAAVTSASAVVWDHPTARFILTANEVWVPYAPRIAPAFSVELAEVF